MVVNTVRIFFTFATNKFADFNSNKTKKTLFYYFEIIFLKIRENYYKQKTNCTLFLIVNLSFLKMNETLNQFKILLVSHQIRQILRKCDANIVQAPLDCVPNEDAAILLSL